MSRRGCLDFVYGAIQARQESGPLLYFTAGCDRLKVNKFSFRVISDRIPLGKLTNPLLPLLMPPHKIHKVIKKNKIPLFRPRITRVMPNIKNEASNDTPDTAKTLTVISGCVNRRQKHQKA